MEEKKVKDFFGKDFNVDKLKAGVEAMMNKVNPQFEKIIAEQRKLSMPKSKKNIIFNGVQCSVSLIEDGRVIIQLPSQDATEAAYKHLDDFDPKIIVHLRTEVDRLIYWNKKREEELNKQLHFEINKPWYKKLFGK